MLQMYYYEALLPDVIRVWSESARDHDGKRVVDRSDTREAVPRGMRTAYYKRVLYQALNDLIIFTTRKPASTQTTTVG